MAASRPAQEPLDRLLVLISGRLNVEDRQGYVGLVAAAQQGNLAAFGELVRRFQDMAYAAAFSQLGDPHRAEDAAQEALLAAFSDLPQLREPAAFPGWLRRIVIRQCHRLTRGARPEALPLIQAAGVVDHAPAPEQVVQTSELVSDVRAAIGGLPEHERLATALYYIGDYSQAEVAAFLGVPVTTVKKRLYAARRRLKERMLQMVQGELREHRPSRAERFTETVQLIAAVKHGDVKIIAALLDRDPSLITAQERDRPLLEIAGMYGYSGRTARYKPVVSVLLARGAAYDIFAAAYLNDPGRAAILLAADPSLVQARDATGLTALHHAAERGATKVAHLLIRAGADVNARDSHGHPPLHNASHAGPWKHRPAEAVIRLLIDNGAEVDVFLAAATGMTGRLRTVLDTDPSLIGARDRAGNTPLFHAAHNLHLEAIDLLLERGADVNARGEHGQTVVTAAVSHSWDKDGPEVVARLRAAGGVLDIFDACAVGDAERVTELLAERPERLHERFWGGTLLHLAARWDQPQVAEVVVAAGLDVNIKDDDGKTAMHAACSFDKSRMMDWLHTRGGKC
jgi:RNA polymerase sigma factor (sigma-70 family)